jgi:phosphomevalonate kinase
VPHFSTFGKNYERRFKDTDLFEQIFYRILKTAADKKLISAEHVFIDSPHVKASYLCPAGEVLKYSTTTRLFDKITNSFLSTIEISRKTKENGALLRKYNFFKKKLKIRGISVALSN